MVERPLECSRCKKKAEVKYSEIVNGITTTFEMCKTCPILQSKFVNKPMEASTLGEEKHLSCNHCQTTLESILMGHPLGCKECYQAFSKILINQLIETEKIAPHLKPHVQAAKTSTLHIGKSPTAEHNEETSRELNELNEALSEALHGENYEQAAWLRDQINALMEKSYE